MYPAPFHHLRLVGAIALTLAATGAFAQDKACIELTTSGETEQQYVDEQGKQATRLVPVAKVVPGDQVVWTITARNVCNEPVENVVVANPVPEHMTYVADSAMGVGTQITFSVDGKQFQPLTQLEVSDANGKRAASAADVRAIRWSYAQSFAPNATAFVRYRATVK